ncbi:MAG: phospho-N-acetylmuramoyl-pentapeptide-transferase [Deltaproteobacteria bacterium]|nr:phospho-N-acetylmuramoyl-pentapeptide-transferase [Deltaproteobacteria bacterium]
MLYHFLYSFSTSYSIFNVFKYITFRTLGASLTALTVCFILGPFFIKYLTKKQARQVIRTDGPPTHLTKAGTPTMGGLLILISVFVATLLWADLSNLYIWLSLAITFFYGLVGFVDDYLKVIRKNPKGIPGRYKILGQMFFGFIVVWFLYQDVGVDTRLNFPFFKNIVIDLGWFYIPFILFVIVGTSNAVNLTDGLDGLAIGPIMIAFTTFLIFVYVAGHFKIAEYLQIPYIPGAGELSIFCAAIVASGLGFLWYNAYPATVFMGDIGSLALGGALAIVATICKSELLLVIVGGIFVLEALSVMTQVFSYKLWKRRVFKMAPLHHHFELKGWAEPKVIVRFWIISIILALIALSTLKLR